MATADALASCPPALEIRLARSCRAGTVWWLVRTTGLAADPADELPIHPAPWRPTCAWNSRPPLCDQHSRWLVRAGGPRCSGCPDRCRWRCWSPGAGLADDGPAPPGAGVDVVAWARCAARANVDGWPGPTNDAYAEQTAVRCWRSPPRHQAAAGIARVRPGADRDGGALDWVAVVVALNRLAISKGLATPGSCCLLDCRLALLAPLYSPSARMLVAPVVWVDVPAEAAQDIGSAVIAGRRRVHRGQGWNWSSH